MYRAIDPAPAKLALSAFATSLPGRIYAEVPTFQEAKTLARAISELDATHIRPLTLDEYFHVLRVTDVPKPHRWARVESKKKKWHWYKGDTGLVKKVEGQGKLYLYLIPRLTTPLLEKVQSQPPQALVNRLHLQNLPGAAVVVDGDGSFKNGKETYNADGLMMVDLDDIDILPLAETLPTTTELTIFRSTKVIHNRMANWTETRIMENNMKVGARVKIIAGEYCGLVGELKEVSDEEFKVYIPSQGIIEDVMKNNVRASYQIGDQIKILCGKHQDLVAWIIAISPKILTILNVEKEIEVRN